MGDSVEHEICGNCKKEIPQHNYVMHTAHCARNITLCPTCKEPIPKNNYESHKRSCVAKVAKTPQPLPLAAPLERSQYYHQRKEVEDRKVAARNERKMEKYERLVDTGYTLKSSSSKNVAFATTKNDDDSVSSTKSNGGAISRGYDFGGRSVTNAYSTPPPSAATNKLLACKFCDLELPKLDLEEHENYCGTRTDKCLQCGELVMFKNKQVHLDSNHGFVKLKDEPGPRPSWESTTDRSLDPTPASPRRRPSPFRPFVDYDPTPYMPSAYSQPPQPQKEKGESYKEISRRLDCKTEYIRNLLHDSASITVPLRHNGAIPRNHFNHNKGPAPQPPRRRRNPPTELTIPCEFCQTPIPHEELIQHETGCRPDLARFNPRRRARTPEEDDYFVAPPPHSPEVELPCEFCAEMIPSSRLLSHQATCI